jgi:hypothetical protein
MYIEPVFYGHLRGLEDSRLVPSQEAIKVLDRPPNCTLISSWLGKTALLTPFVARDPSGYDL